MHIALDTNILAYAEGVGDVKRCKSARDLVARLPGSIVTSVTTVRQNAASLTLGIIEYNSV